MKWAQVENTNHETKHPLPAKTTGSVAGNRSGKNCVRDRNRELDLFNCAAERYLQRVREYLHEPPEREVDLPCRNESEMRQVTDQLDSYYILCLRKHAREGPHSLSSGEAQEPSGLPNMFGPPPR